ncbi:SAP domain-containing protein [Algoriphagus limi]|uniref:SAP domain-containing protein n=1 Tax=Algoriphagus limi TaxID=2975273 RepID=A0ABT2GA60_9BACT|nr:SAP domain-containing protein [Algoriphagus limi]MCS5490885.1 SAP domain-containing protein [Algoriphagus limi]
MDFFKRFFGNPDSEKKHSRNEQGNSYPKYNYELEFLDALNKTPTNKLFGLNTYWEGRYKELLGNLSPILEKFLSQGMLEISLKEEALKVSELKKILNDNNLPQSGKKEILAKRVFEEVADKSYAANLIPFYKLTQKGQDAIDLYRENFFKEYYNFQLNQADLFLQKNLNELESNHFQFRELHPDQRYLLGKFDSFGERAKSILKKLCQNEGFRIKWNFLPEFEKRLRVLIAFKEIGIRLFDEFKNEYLKEIDLDELYPIIQGNPERLNFGSKEEFVTNLVNFEYQYFWNQGKLQEIIDYRKSSSNFRFQGIQVLNDGCECQAKYGEEKFTWDNIKDLPVLPRHVKCRCIINLM